MVGITRCRCDPHQRSFPGPRFPLRYACRGGLDEPGTASPAATWRLGDLSSPIGRCLE
jgi:hypothetical protein